MQLGQKVKFTRDIIVKTHLIKEGDKGIISYLYQSIPPAFEVTVGLKNHTVIVFNKDIEAVYEQY